MPRWRTCLAGAKKRLRNPPTGCWHGCTASWRLLMSGLTPSPDFEDQLRAACALPAPDPQFVSQLRSSLAAHAAYLSQQQAQSPRLAFFRRPAWAAAIIILLALAGATFAVGPQRVWAAVQGLLGYIPGVGIVP